MPQLETLSNHERNLQLPFLLNDKDDGAEEGPCLEDTSAYCLFRTSQISKKIKECGETLSKNNKLCIGSF